MAKSSGGITAQVRALAERVAEEQGVLVWDVEYKKSGSEWELIITIDTPSGVGLDDCERFHRAVDKLIDEADPIDHEYSLQVSSPGIGRELRTPSHIAAYIGKRIRVSLYAPVDGSKQFEATLSAYGDGMLTLERDGMPGLRLEKQSISRLSAADDIK